MTAEPSPRPPLDSSALAVLAPGWRVEVLDASPSTNAAVADRARRGEDEGLVVAAEHQTAGRGRLDRVWVTPARAALTFSVLLRPGAVPAARWPWLPLLAGVAAVEGVRRAAGVDAVLKWPNDVLVGDGKLAGILVERVESAGALAAVVGIGLNVSSTRAELPVETATSLALEGATSLDRTALLAAILAALRDEYDVWRVARGDPAGSLRPSYTRLCATVGQQVRVALPGGGQLTGEATGVDDGGRLEVATPDGPRVLGAGDVVHLRVT
ncbi:MAG: biotin--[acetyl-CoA-carboxylase] ligase [Nocardioidaceae bacterium]